MIAGEWLREQARQAETHLRRIPEDMQSNTTKRLLAALDGAVSDTSANARHDDAKIIPLWPVSALAEDTDA